MQEFPEIKRIDVDPSPEEEEEKCWILCISCLTAVDITRFPPGSLNTFHFKIHFFRFVLPAFPLPSFPSARTRIQLGRVGREKIRYSNARKSKFYRRQNVAWKKDISPR